MNGTESETEQPAGEPVLPTVQQLTALAAQPRFAGLPCEAALSQALAMWKNATEHLRKEAEFNQLLKEYYVEPIEKLPRPAQWPASFDIFLKFVVGSDRDDARFPRFRKFLLYEIRVKAHMDVTGEARVKHEAEVQHVADARADAVAKAVAQGKSGVEAASQAIAEVVDTVNFQPIRLDVEALDTLPSAFEEDAVAKQFKSHQESQLGEAEWDSLARRYHLWWSGYVHRLKSRAGMKGAAAKNVAKTALSTE